MVETVTKNYSWTKPEVTKSPATWGGFLNSDLDSIDGIVFSNQQGLVPIGSMTMWLTATPPANWLICNGQSLATTGTYAALFAVLGYAYGGSGPNFNLPNLTDRFPIGVGANALAAAGGAATVTLDATTIPAHAHPIVDVAHNHGVEQSPHGHGDPGHTHGVSSAYQDAHNHTVSTVVFTGSGVTSGGASWSAGSATTSSAQPPVHVSIASAGTGLQAANANVSLDASGTGLSTTQNAGGGLAHNNVPPFLAINFIVRFA